MGVNLFTLGSVTLKHLKYKVSLFLGKSPTGFPAERTKTRGLAL